MFKEEISKKVKQSVSEVKSFVSEAKDKALDYLEEKQVIFELTSKINEEKEALDELYCSYGKVLYSFESLKDSDKYSALMARKLSGEIRNKRDVIESLEKELENYKKSIEKQLEPEKVFCTSCGKEFSSNEEFCNKCGSKLKRD